MSKMGAIGYTSDWLLSIMNIRNELSLVTLRVPLMFKDHNCSKTLVWMEFENPMNPATWMIRIIPSSSHWFKRTSDLWYLMEGTKSWPWNIMSAWSKSFIQDVVKVPKGKFRLHQTSEQVMWTVLCLLVNKRQCNKCMEEEPLLRIFF